MAVYLVTGGAGFIGSHIVEELLKRGETVRVLDNFSTGKRENLEPFLDKIELMEGDLRSQHQVREAVRGVDFISHQGALPSVPRSVQDPITSDQVNAGGTLNILEAAKEEGVKRVVVASSSSVYGANEEVPKLETMIPEPISPYAVTKLTGEHYCRVFSHIYGLETVALRYFNAFGPKMDPTSAYSAFVSIFVVGILDGSPLVVHGDGTISRDFTYITNVVEANMRALDAEGVSGEAFNVGCGSSMSLNEVIDTLRELTGKRGNISYGPPRPGDVQQSLADISKAREMLSYEPRVPADEGLKRAVLWYGKGK